MATDQHCKIWMISYLLTIHSIFFIVPSLRGKIYFYRQFLLFFHQRLIFFKALEDLYEYQDLEQHLFGYLLHLQILFFWLDFYLLEDLYFFWLGLFLNQVNHGYFQLVYQFNHFVYFIIFLIKR